MNADQQSDDAVVDPIREARSREEFTDLSKLIRSMSTRALGVTAETDSALARIDAATTVAPFSSMVQFQLQASANHLSMLVDAVDADGAVRYGGYSLLRGALESGVTAMWMLAPDSEDELVLRSLKLTWNEQENTAQFASAAGFDHEPDMKRIQLSLEADRDRVPGLLGRSLKSLPTRTRTVHEVDGMFPRRLIPSIETSWKLSSGFAHGNQSTVAIAMQRRRIEGDVPNRYLAESSWAIVTAMTRTACAVVDAAIDRLSELTRV